MWRRWICLTYIRRIRRIPENPSPRTIFKVVLYAYMNGDFSSRDMEEVCRRDINFMYLLEGTPVPDHATFARFHTLHFALCSKKILAAVTKFLYSIGEISGEDIFIDGTKIEVYANKYTFVWKKATTKNMEKLLKKLAAFVESCEVLWSSIFVTLMANKIGGLQFGIYRNCQISSRVFHTAVAALPLTKANRSDFE